MSVFTKLVIVSDLFSKQIRKESGEGVKEVTIHVDSEQSFVITASVIEDFEEMVIKATNKSVYIVVRNGRVERAEYIPFFLEILDNILDKADILIAETPITSTVQYIEREKMNEVKPVSFKEVKKKPKVTLKKGKKGKTIQERYQQMDRLLDRINTYQRKYETFNEDKFLKRKDKLLKLLKTTTITN
jgi:hypothetical protein